MAERAQQERCECVDDLQELLGCESTTTAALLDHAAVESAIASERCAQCPCDVLRIMASSRMSFSDV